MDQIKSNSSDIFTEKFFHLISSSMKLLRKIYLKYLYYFYHQIFKKKTNKEQSFIEL